jgi:hypothetical protein
MGLYFGSEASNLRAARHSQLRPVPSGLAPDPERGIDQPWRAVSSSGDGEHIAEGCEPLDMDRPSPGRGHVFLAPGGRSEEVAHLVMGPAETGGAEVGLEPPHRPVAPFYSSVILFEMVV